MRTIGVYADPEYRNHERIMETIKSNVGPNTLITLPVVSDLDVKMRNFILTNTELPVRDWQPDPVEEQRMQPHQVDLLSDHMFLAYIKFFKDSKLLIFARKHHVIQDQFTYTDRIQSMIIAAHLAKLRYEIIRED